MVDRNSIFGPFAQLGTAGGLQPGVAQLSCLAPVTTKFTEELTTKDTKNTKVEPKKFFVLFDGLSFVTFVLFVVDLS
jgi:hypothetical protein